MPRIANARKPPIPRAGGASHDNPANRRPAGHAADRPPSERVLILGATPFTAEMLRELDRRPELRIAVVGVLDDRAPRSGTAGGYPFLGPLAELERVIDECAPDRIVVGLAQPRGATPVEQLFDAHVSRGIVVEPAVEFYERLTGQVAIESLTPMGVVYSGRFRPPRAHQALARALSLCVAVAALVLLAPLMAVIAFAIKLDSPGPVFFTHLRLGYRGRPFGLMKFRTMRAGQTRRSEWEADNRDHVTRIGRWLRTFRLDELPQFVNILRGDMNLVGPRPHPVSNHALFALVARNLSDVTGVPVDCYALRLLVRPGLTGWAQVRYRYANNLSEEMEKLRYDLYYIKHLSAWLDARVIVETAAVVLRSRRAAHAGARATRPAIRPRLGYPSKLRRTKEA